MKNHTSPAINPTPATAPTTIPPMAPPEIVDESSSPEPVGVAACDSGAVVWAAEALVEVGASIDEEDAVEVDEVEAVLASADFAASIKSPRAMLQRTACSYASVLESQVVNLGQQAFLAPVFSLVHSTEPSWLQTLA